MNNRDLDQEKIINMAISILENEGFENLSMRKLASKLGVKAASLYNHLPNKIWLVKELQKHFANPKNRLYNSNLDATSWQELVSSMINATYKEFMARPYTLELFSKYSGENDQGVVLFEKYLVKMVSFGFSISDAAYISNLIGIYTVGHCTFALGVKKQKEEAPESIAIKANSQTPLTNEFAGQGWFDLEKSYTFAVTHILDGISSLRNAGNHV